MIEPGSLNRDEIYAVVDAYAALIAKPVAQKVREGLLTPISIGTQCGTAAILRRMNLRFGAYPFDWLFSSLDMIEHCLVDDFATFLDPAQHEPVPEEDRKDPTVTKAHHRFYRDHMGVEHVFNHHEMPDKLPHFERAVERFRKAPNPVFVHIARDRPNKATLASVRLRLPGPLLAFHVSHGELNNGFSEHEGVITYRAFSDIGPMGFHEKVDEIAFATYLSRALAVIAEA